MPVPRTAKVRLQRFLADAGVASRRHAEELILEGRVLVNGAVVTELPAFVDPENDTVIANGTRVRPEQHAYFIVHKPKGVVTTNRDPAGRMRAIDLLPEMKARLFPVGRLDAESTGLLLMTNDGELAQRLTHPRFGVPKTYRVEVRGQAPADLTEQMKKGVYLSEGRASADNVTVVHTSRQQSVLLVRLHEGRNRQVRRMLARLGFPVRSLKRVQFGPLSLHGLPLGAARQLSPKEVEALREAASGAKTAPRLRQRRGRPSGAARSGESGTSRPRRKTTKRAGPGTGAARSNPRRRKDSGEGGRRLIT